MAPLMHQCEAILSGRCENIECPHAELHIPHGDELAMEYLGKQYKDTKCDTAEVCKSEDILVKCVVPPEEDFEEEEDDYGPDAEYDPDEAQEWHDFDPEC